jgi:hypothetical protein
LPLKQVTMQPSGFELKKQAILCQASLLFEGDAAHRLKKEVQNGGKLTFFSQNGSRLDSYKNKRMKHPSSVFKNENSLLKSSNVHLSKKNIRQFCVVLWCAYVRITKFMPSILIFSDQRSGLCPGLVFVQNPILKFSIGASSVAPKN